MAQRTGGLHHTRLDSCPTDVPNPTAAAPCALPPAALATFCFFKEYRSKIGEIIRVICVPIPNVSVRLRLLGVCRML